MTLKDHNAVPIVQYCGYSVVAITIMTCVERNSLLS